MHPYQQLSDDALSNSNLENVFQATSSSAVSSSSTSEGASVPGPHHPAG
jgi:hypothetical protein